MSERIICGLMLMCVVIGVVFLFKNENAYRNRIKILNAMFEYNMEMIKQKKYNLVLNYGDFVEPYIKTTLRFWDWGYRHIVPKPVFLKIAKYL